MHYMDQIKELAIMVNEGLTIYIAVHNKILKESGTFRSFFKNLLDRGIAMSSLLEESENLKPIWDEIHQKIEEFRLYAYSVLLKDEKQYFDILSRYVAAVRRTVAALVDWQRLLYKGSKGFPNNTMTWKTHKQKERIYKDTISELSHFLGVNECMGSM